MVPVLPRVLAGANHAVLVHTEVDPGNAILDGFEVPAIRRNSTRWNFSKKCRRIKEIFDGIV